MPLICPMTILEHKISQSSKIFKYFLEWTRTTISSLLGKKNVLHFWIFCYLASFSPAWLNFSFLDKLLTILNESFSRRYFGKLQQPYQEWKHFLQQSKKTWLTSILSLATQTHLSHSHRQADVPVDDIQCCSKLPLCGPISFSAPAILQNVCKVFLAHFGKLWAFGYGWWFKKGKVKQ